MLTVMTGGTSGLGRVTASLIARETGGLRVIGARRTADTPPGWTGLPLDLARLESVRAFVAALPQGPIDRLLLNAGIQLARIDLRTVDGVETTFATNHLAHYLLLRLLMPRLAPGALITITSSGTHDPAERTGVPPPRHANADLLADPRRDPDIDKSAMTAGMRAYSTSKLCNLLTARALAQSDEARRLGWRVFAYDPGFTPGTGLAGNHNWVVRRLLWPLLPLVVPFAGGMNTLEAAGKGLADLASIAQPPVGAIYASLRKGRLTWPEPSALARDDAVMQRLWHDSAAMTGTQDLQPAYA